MVGQAERIAKERWANPHRVSGLAQSRWGPRQATCSNGPWPSRFSRLRSRWPVGSW